MMQIRLLTQGEIDTAIEFLQAMLEAMASYGGHPVQDSDSLVGWFRDRIQSQLASPDYLFLVAVPHASPQQLIGLLEANLADAGPVFLPKLSLHISALYVVPEHRRCGVGRSLIKAALQWGREKGCTEVDLHVLQQSPARSLYEALGFAAFQIEMRRQL